MLITCRDQCRGGPRNDKKPVGACRPGSTPYGGYWKRPPRKLASTSPTGPSSPSSMRSTYFCPKPPRNLPGPAESCQSERSSTTRGTSLSMTSAGVLPTLYGNARHDTPSFVARAPSPPLETLNGEKSAP